MFALLISASAYANNNANIQGVAFGTNYETALAGIKSQFGTPLSANKRQIVYKNMTFKGVKFDKATFKPTALVTPISVRRVLPQHP